MDVRFILQQDEYETITRHNSLYIIRVHIISCYVLLDVSMVTEEVGYSFAPSGVPRYDDFFKSFNYYPPPATYLGYPTLLRFVRVVLFLIILLHLFYVLYVSLLPLFRWLPVRPSTVVTSLNPNPVLTTGESRMFLASGCSGPVSSGSFRFPP